MNKITPTDYRAIPSTVDILIIGGTGIGVSLALSASRAGASVFLAASRPYLGEDICGDMRLWPEAGSLPETKLSRAIFGSPPRPATPMQVKCSLEQSLAEAEVPFLLNVFCMNALRNRDGKVRGVDLATRSGTLRIRARLVIDATSEAVLGRMVGGPVRQGPRGMQTVLHTTLCQGEGVDAEDEEIVSRPEGFSGTNGEATYRLSARTYQLGVDFGQGTLRDLARVEAQIVERCYVPGEFQHQERIRLLPAGDSAPSEGLVTPDLSCVDIPHCHGMFLLSLSGVNSSLLDAALACPIRAIDLGERLGLCLAEEALKRDEKITTSTPDDVEIPVLDTFDVVVLGGGTGGAPAAISAARKGADTLVVESTDQLGGVGTVGQIARYWFGNITGFTSEIDAGVFSMENDPEITKRKGQWSVAAKSAWYHQQCQENGVTLLFRSLCSGVEMKDGRVTGLYIATPRGYGLVRAKCVVDATGCADITAAAGAPTRQIGGDHMAVQGTGLAGINPGTDYHNTDHNFSDDTNVHDTTNFLVSTKLKFRNHFDAGQLVDSRERRQIIGDIILGPSDFLSERRYPDTICVASSNFDTHGFTIHPVFMVKPPHKKRLWADVPFRALLPKGLERVLTTGLGVSAHRDALPVIRMQADVQNQGYAAGYAAAMSALENLDLRDLPIKELQRHLVEIGSLPDRVLTDEDNFPVGEERLLAAIRNELDELEGLALIFEDPERSLPMLRDAFALAKDDKDRQLRLALILAFMGDVSGREVLQTQVDGAAWDKGWNYTGMGQFGMSLSELDSMIIALGLVGDKSAWPVLIGKLKSLPHAPDFSHCRALSEAFEALYLRHPNAKAATELAGVLNHPEISGHAQTSLKSVQSRLTDDPNETHVRNAALRELHLARALFRCGDYQDLGKRILGEYAKDLRGHFARHARALLG